MLGVNDFIRLSTKNGNNKIGLVLGDISPGIRIEAQDC